MSFHIPVLLKESMEGLKVRPGGVYVDATYGGGGHAKEILQRLTTGILIAFDKNAYAIEHAGTKKNLVLIHDDFRNMNRHLSLRHIEQIDGLITDLGISSRMIDTPPLGFSHRFNGPLDMRFSRNTGITAADIVNSYTEKDLGGLFSRYGEVRNASALAGNIINARKREPIADTFRLKEIALKCCRPALQNKYLSQVFQALRIEVNDELNALKELLESCARVMVKGGRLAVISYHSLEDRLVKNFISKGNCEGKIVSDIYGHHPVIFRPVNRKPIVAGNDETERNSRARSAKLRIAEKL